MDVSTIYNGYFSDSSRMFVIGETTPEREKIVRVAKECMEEGIRAVKPWTFLGDMADAVNSHAKENGCSIRPWTWRARCRAGISRRSLCELCGAEGDGNADGSGHGIYDRADGQRRETEEILLMTTTAGRFIRKTESPPPSGKRRYWLRRTAAKCSYGNLRRQRCSARM